MAVYKTRSLSDHVALRGMRYGSTRSIFVLENMLLSLVAFTTGETDLKSF